MDNDDSKHERNNSEAMSFPPESPHDRRTSTFAGANRLSASRKEQQTQLTGQADGSQEGGQTLAVPYAPGSAALLSSSSSISVSIAPTVHPPLSGHTADDIDNIIRSIITRSIIADKMDQSAVKIYFDPELKPPITQESLAELDMPRIINNPKLRHDVNFDRELHFRPNLDGCKGKEKQKQAEQYWEALKIELVVYNYVRARIMNDSNKEADWQPVMRQSLRRLKGVFQAIHEIMKTLVPDYDQQAVDERLEVDHLMQQIQNGVCDLIDLANWLAKILKRHCAPMRDSMVDLMRQEIECGVHENDHGRLVEGLRKLMSILEAMKLDVANHQIRHMRLLLVEDTVNFQRQYNDKRIKDGKINPQKSKAWLDAELESPTFAEVDPVSPQDAFCAALLRDIVLSQGLNFPQAFYLDTDRLLALRLELHATVSHRICEDVFRELAGPGIEADQLASVHDALHSAITAIVGARGKFADLSENIAAEMVRILLVNIEGRYQAFDDALAVEAENKLKERLQPQSASFQRAARHVCQRVLPKLRRRANELSKKNEVELHNELVPVAMARPPPLGFGAMCEPVQVAPPRPDDPDDDLVRRMAHMLVLHWRVWADLVYLIDAPSSQDEDGSSDAGGSGSPHAAAAVVASSTVPVAQAVYGPGQKLIPVALKVVNVPSISPPPPQQLPTPTPSPPPPESNQATAPNTSEQTSEESSSSNVDSEQRRQAA